MEVSVLGGFAGDSQGSYCAGVYFLTKSLACGSGAGVYSFGFCEIFGSIFFTEHFWMTAFACFICDILQIYMLRKNILLDIILYITCM